jgi:hypothetical protein
LSGKSRNTQCFPWRECGYCYVRVACQRGTRNEPWLIVQQNCDSRLNGGSEDIADIMITRGTRDVVEAAHDFVGRYVGPDGAIPADRIFEMGHMLAHCGMANLMTFLRAHGFENPGEFVDFVRRHEPSRLMSASQ